MPTGRRGDATSGDASRGDSSSHGVPPGVRGGRPTTLVPNGGDAVRVGEEEVLAAGRRSSICGRGERSVAEPAAAPPARPSPDDGPAAAAWAGETRHWYGLALRACAAFAGRDF